jgi:hypothetical protein
MKREVEEARRVLMRTAEAASAAERQLLHVEKRVEEKWAVLATLLSELRMLEAERHEALMLARQFSELEWTNSEEADFPVSELDLGDLSAGLDLSEVQQLHASHGGNASEYGNLVDEIPGARMSPSEERRGKRNRSAVALGAVPMHAYMAEPQS